MILNINPNWTFKEVVINAKTIKAQYSRVLSSFSYFKLHDKVSFLKNARNDIYSFNFELWKREKIWDYLNDNLDLSILQKLK